MESLLPIGQVSKLTGASIRTIRYYEEVGLLQPTSTTESGYRYYGQKEVKQLEEILLLKNLGMTLKEIKQAMAFHDQGSFLKVLINKEKDLKKRAIQLKNTQDALQSFIEYLKCDRTTTVNLSNLLQRNLIKGECLEVSEIVMEVKVFNLENEIKTIGVSTQTPLLPIDDQHVLENFWEKYWKEDLRSKIPNRKMPATQLGISTNPSPKGDSFTYFIAEEVTSYEDIPSGFEHFTLPKGLYAVITFKAHSFDELINSGLAKANEYITQTWLPQSDYEFDGIAAFEVYDERCRKHEKPEMDFYIPIKKKG